MKFSLDGGGCFPTGRHYPGIAHLIKIATAGLAEEWLGETALSDLSLVAIDTETTGRDPAVDRIVEIGCIVWQGGTVQRRQGWLVNPERPIPEDATQVHGIKDDDVKNAPVFREIVDDLMAVLERHVPVAYNAEFDRDFLHAELGRSGASGRRLPPAARHGVVWMDPLIWAREIQKEEKSKALGEVCARLGIELERAHRAEDDAEAAVRVLAKFCEDVRVPKTYAAFVQEQKRLGRLFEEERIRWRN